MELLTGVARRRLERDVVSAADAAVAAAALRIFRAMVNTAAGLGALVATAGCLDALASCLVSGGRALANTGLRPAALEILSVVAWASNDAPPCLVDALCRRSALLCERPFEWARRALACGSIRNPCPEPAAKRRARPSEKIQSTKNTSRCWRCISRAAPSSRR